MFSTRSNRPCRLLTKMAAREGVLFALALGAAASTAAQEAARQDNPFEPLSKDEISAAVALLRTDGKASERTRFTIVTLNEPAKERVLQAGRSTPLSREALVMAYEYDGDRTFEGVVDLTAKRVVSWNQVSGVQPPAIKDDDSQLLTTIVRGDSRWRAAIQQRGLNPDTVKASAYPIGPFSPAGATGRLAIARNEGVVAYVNLTSRKVLELVDNGPPPARISRFRPESLPPARSGVNPLQVTQPRGPSFTLRGHEVRWQNWQFRFGMRPREGLVLYTVGYEDAGKVRSVLYRAGLSELFVPYGDLGEGRFFLTAFDAGEAGLGSYGDITMSPGDCPANAVFTGAVMHDYRGAPRDIPRATCVYERDGGVLWRHGGEVRRAQELVLSSIVRVDNYDYGFNWVFREDGTLELELLLTGLMNARPLAAKSGTRDGEGYATAVGSHVEAMNHQHLFNFRLDMDVDGNSANSLVEMNVETPPMGAQNPNGNALVEKETVFQRERDAKRMVNVVSARKWKVISAQRNALGQATAYVLVPGDNAVPYQDSSTVLRKRAGFVDAHLWVTPYNTDELYAAGSYVYGSRGGDGLPTWTAANRPIANTDIVLWYTLGVTHIPRPEDWPVMPVHQTGFKLVPFGFFTQNPALDVAAP
ncbi:MAG: primary-amine oxidase [Gemmatimonadetes bacterium]|nr:primary-amine oxidase [Gemmatimonadota bacterium]